MKCGEAEFPHKQFRYMTVYLLGAEEPGGCWRKAFSPWWLWAGGVADVKGGDVEEVGWSVGGWWSFYLVLHIVPSVSRV